MRGKNTWSYAPYRPLLTEVGDIYICRVAPAETSIHFEWLSLGEGCEYSVYCRQRDKGEFVLCGTTVKNNFDVNELFCDTDYEFFVS